MYTFCDEQWLEIYGLCMYRHTGTQNKCLKLVPALVPNKTTRESNTNCSCIFAISWALLKSFRLLERFVRVCGWVWFGFCLLWIYCLLVCVKKFCLCIYEKISCSVFIRFVKLMNYLKNKFHFSRNFSWWIPKENHVINNNIICSVHVHVYVHVEECKIRS